MAAHVNTVIGSGLSGKVTLNPHTTSHATMEVSTQDGERILADLRHKTGLSFCSVQSIDVDQSEVARRALPIVFEWFDRVEHQGLRRAMLTLFRGPEARPYVSRLLELLEGATDVGERAFILETLLDLVTSQNAAEIWSVAQTHWNTPLWGLLAARLARQRSVRERVIQFVCERLSRFEVRELRSIASISDLRIRTWFAGHLSSPDPILRSIAEKSTRRRKALSRKFSYANRGPAEKEEIYSTECDLDRFASVLCEVAKEHAVDIPEDVADPLPLLSLERDRWVVALLKRRAGSTVGLWLRREDEDVIELWLTDALKGD